MTLTEITLAVAALLLTPGPTNTLIALAGAERGWTRAMPLVLAEIAGYLATVLPLALVGHALFSAAPLLRSAITLGAAIWVLGLGLRMWRLPAPGGAARTVSARLVLVTTLLNPKALILGLVLMPAPDLPGLALHLSVLVAVIVAVAALWAGLGAALTGRGAGGLPAPLRRAAALWLVAVALWLAARGAGLVA